MSTNTFTGQIGEWMEWIYTYREYFKAQIRQFMTSLVSQYEPFKHWVKANIAFLLTQIQQGAQSAYSSLRYYVVSIPSAIQSAMAWGRQLVAEGVAWGVRMGTYLLSQFNGGFWRALNATWYYFINFPQWAYQNVMWCGEKLLQGLQLGYRAMTNLLVMMRDGLWFSLESTWYYLRQFPGWMYESVIWCAQKLLQGLQLGYRAMSTLLLMMRDGLWQALQTLWQFIQYIPTLLHAFGKHLLNLFLRGFDLGRWLIINSLSLLKSIILFIKDCVIELAGWVKDNFWACMRVFGEFCQRLWSSLVNFFYSIPEYILKLYQGLVEFGKALWEFGAFVFKHLGIFLDFVWRNVRYFIAHLPQYITQLYEYTLKFFAFLRDALVELGKFMFELGQKMLQELTQLFRVIAQHIWQFILNIPHYLTQLYQETLKVMVAVKESLIKLGNALFELGKEMLSMVWRIGRVILDQVIPLCKTLIRKAFSTLWTGIGIVLGVSTALIDFLGDGLNALTLQMGVNLTHYAFFETAKFGLSLALCGLILYQMARWTYYGAAALFSFGAGMNILQRGSDRDLKVDSKPEPRPEMEKIETHTSAVVRQFDRQRRATTHQPNQNKSQDSPKSDRSAHHFSKKMTQ